MLLLQTFVVVSILVAVSAKRKNLAPSNGNNGANQNKDTLELVFNAQCLETSGQSAEDAIDEILHWYPCLRRHHTFEEVFESPNYRWVYVDFAGNDVAIRQCIGDDMDLDLECLVSAEYESILETYEIDYTNDNCNHIWLGSDPGFWGLAMWNPIVSYHTPFNFYRCPDFGPDPTKVDIYIIDTGVMETHVEFEKSDGSSRVTALPYSLPGDGNGHGTAVAGIAAGANTGTSADNFDIYYYRMWIFATSELSNAFTTVLNRIKANGDRRAVINLSFGGHNSPIFNDILKDIHDTYNVITVTAAGNDGVDASNIWPCNSEATICVGAFDSNYTAANFSNYGATVDVWAPGVDIKTTNNDDDYEILEGTSMAAPFVTGEVANLLQRVGNDELMTCEAVLEELTRPSRSTIIPGYDGRPDGVGVRGQCGPLSFFSIL